jgi:FkbM family methyltransferase
MRVTTVLKAPFGYVRWRRLLSDAESVAAFRDLRNERDALRAQLLAGRAPAVQRTPMERVPIRIRALGGTVWLRRATSDVRVLEEAFHIARNHVPPRRLVPASARRIWDLGANIGLVSAHYAVLYPHARIVSVELDKANAELCRVNIARWADRFDVIQAAVWPEDGTTGYYIEAAREYAAHAKQGGEPVRALSLNTLVESTGAPIDFVKMDIEGAEADVLSSHTEWASEVRCMKVESHHPYTPEACAAQLDRLGFRTRIDRDSTRAVLAWRDSGRKGVGRRSCRIEPVSRCH